MEIISGGYFERHKASLRMTISGSLFRGHASPSGELRRAQLGACMAVAAHFTVSDERALVSMPTGSGKSAVMTLVPFLMASERVLVVTPSKLLREQLANEFTGLRVLHEHNVLPMDIPGPRTTAVRTILRNGTAWRALERFDVVVGTPNVLSPGYSQVASPPSDLFDLVLLDEAHHAGARTYQELLACFEGVPTVLFTATPFRRDRRRLPAESVYTYSLKQALDEKVLSPIDFQPVDVADNGFDEELDAALAAEAVATARQPAHVAAESRIIARTNSVRHANKLVEVYRDVGVEMGLITASTSERKAREVLQQLRHGALAGLVSVGVLGEGFDFPTLKVGVYHRRHASLPATLQFLGRITRVLPDGPTAVLLAARAEVNDETRELYASDAAWGTLVPALADAAVEAEAQRRQYLRQFDPTPTRPLSLSALRPRKDVKIFQYPDDGLDLEAPVSRLGDGEVIYQGVDRERRLAVFVTEHLDRPEWMDADTLDRFRYELHVVVKDLANQYVFVHGTRDTTVNALLAAMGYDDPVLVDPLWLDRLMAAVVLLGYHSVGMRSARAASGRLAAYRMMAGPNVGNAVLPSETRSYGTGHAIAQVRDPMKITSKMLEQGITAAAGSTSLGLSYRRAKVFSPDLVHLFDFRAWCDRLTALVEDQAQTNPRGLPGLHLRSPRPIEEFPRGPYLVVLDPSLLGGGWRVRDTRHSVVVPLEEIHFTAKWRSPVCLELNAWLESVLVWTGEVGTDGLIKTKSDYARLETAAGVFDASLAALLVEFPPSIFYTDGTSTVGRTLIRPRDDYPDLGQSIVTEWSYTNVDIRAEAKDPAQGKTTIKDHVIQQMSRDPDVEFIIDDDRAHEMADVLVIGRASVSGERAVRLVHCKFSSGDKPGVRVEDLYEVLGQAGRSVIWAHGEQFTRQLAKRLNSGSRVAYGDEATLKSLLPVWMEIPPDFRWTIAVAQPGLHAPRVNTAKNVKVMLNDVLDWVSQHEIAFRVFAHT